MLLLPFFNSDNQLPLLIRFNVLVQSGFSETGLFRESSRLQGIVYIYIYGISVGSYLTLIISAKIVY